MSAATSLDGHRFPTGTHTSTYADITCGGPFQRDAHEENPESILDDHVQRVMKTPGCQSPGTGRHSPKSCSPDGFPGGRGTGLGMAPSWVQGKHPSRQGVKGETSHHKHAHHNHHSGGKPKEQLEAEAAARGHGGVPWNVETNHHGWKPRSFADGTGSNVEQPSYRCMSGVCGKCSGCFYSQVLSHCTAKAEHCGGER